MAGCDWFAFWFGLDLEKSSARLRMIKIRLKQIFLFITIIVSSCEDDPVLGPQVSDCAPGDSYCEISLPGDKNDSKINNPETF